MTNILKKILTKINILLLVISFFFIIYINVYQFFSLDNNPFGKNFFEFFSILLPFVLLMSLYFINYINKHHTVNDNVAYKIVSLFSLIVILYILYRSIFDDNLILWHKTNYHINFDYFNNNLLPMNLILYGLSLVNIILIIECILEKKKS